jgi:hypothetical protein
MKEAELLANSIPSKKTTSRPTPVRDDMRWAAEATNLVRISRSTGTNTVSEDLHYQMVEYITQTFLSTKIRNLLNL